MCLEEDYGTIVHTVLLKSEVQTFTLQTRSTFHVFFIIFQFHWTFVFGF